MANKLEVIKYKATTVAKFRAIKKIMTGMTYFICIFMLRDNSSLKSGPFSASIFLFGAFGIMTCIWKNCATAARIAKSVLFAVTLIPKNAVLMIVGTLVNE